MYHLVVYDDGDKQKEALGDPALRWELLELEPPPPAQAPGPPLPERHAAPGCMASAGPSEPVATERSAAALQGWVASHNLEISRTHPEREGSAWDYIGHRLPGEKSRETAVHATVLTEGRWAAEFKVLLTLTLTLTLT